MATNAGDALAVDVVVGASFMKSSGSDTLSISNKSWAEMGLGPQVSMRNGHVGHWALCINFSRPHESDTGACFIMNA